MDHLNYTASWEGEPGWIIEERIFDSRYLGKCESAFTQGNGYLGVRNALEERYIGETRGMFVNGTFNRFDPHEVPELPNFPDVTAADIHINGHRFSLETGNMEEYCRSMNYRTGEMERSVIWTCPTGERLKLCFKRFVSLNRSHVIGSQITITALDGPVSVKIQSGIDGRMTNTGVQHFGAPDSRIYEKEYLQAVSVTSESKITAVVQAAHRLYLDGKLYEGSPLPYIRNRQNLNCYDIKLQAKTTLRFEKISTVHTSRDQAYVRLTAEEASVMVKKDALTELKELHCLGYNRLFEESRNTWDQFWRANDVRITTKQVFDQTAIRFAIYHLHIMNNPDDNRLGVGAKGLSGEEYKGHSFWDTEIFLMPYYLFSNPKAARTLLEYRYQILKGARIKAQKAGYEGAMYPWESAWIEDEEVCADVIGVDVETGKPMRVLCGEIEIHISADIAYAVWEYYQATKDQEFMEKCGYEIILDTARFWASRAQWRKEKQRYELLNVIGPDEYKEEVDNDVYTNYMAQFNMKKALELLEFLPPSVFHRLNQKMDLDDLKKKVQKVSEKLYLPAPEKDGIIPQNDTYLSLTEINLDKYKRCEQVGTIHQDYSMERLKGVQVSKQGDLVVLMYLFPGLFPDEIVKANYHYYEEHTTHDSSLSKCTHAIVANDLGMEKESYRFFQGAAQTDAGNNLKSCDNGIHSAACGGIWQCVVMGYGGVRVMDGELTIEPRLPKQWDSLEFTINWNGKRMHILAEQGKTEIQEMEQYI